MGIIETADDPETPVINLLRKPSFIPDGALALGVGNTSNTWHVSDSVRKTYHEDPSEPDITKENVKCAQKEANVYLILGTHHLIAECLFISPDQKFFDLRFYPKGTLRDYARDHPETSRSQRAFWALQMVESIVYIHSKGVRHADLRLDQWLLDEELKPRLADFNGSGFDEQPSLNLKATPASGIENASHCLPRDLEKDSSVESDIFALGSSLYELMTNSRPFEGEEDDLIEHKFANHVFPPVADSHLGQIILDCWRGQYPKADLILNHMRDECMRPC